MKKVEQKVFDYLKKAVSFTHDRLKPDEYTSTIPCVLCHKESNDSWLIRMWWKPYQGFWHVWVCDKCYKGK